MLSRETNYIMGSPVKSEELFPGDFVCWKTRTKGQEKTVYGVIVYRYCEEARMEVYYKKYKSTKPDIDEQLKQFFVSEIMEIGTQTLHSVDDRYILLVSRGKLAEA